MLDLSPVAAEALSNIRTQQGLPDQSTVRISAINGSRELRISFVENPGDGDQVAEAYGMSYAVAPEVVDLVGDAMLDFQQSDEDTGFVLRTS